MGGVVVEERADVDVGVLDADLGSPIGRCS